MTLDDMSQEELLNYCAQFVLDYLEPAEGFPCDWPSLRDDLSDFISDLESGSIHFVNNKLVKDHMHG